MDPRLVNIHFGGDSQDQSQDSYDPGSGYQSQRWYHGVLRWTALLTFLGTIAWAIYRGE